MVHLRGNRPVCHYPISALAGWMARVSLTSASRRLPLLIEYLHERNFRLQKIGWNITAFALIPTALLAFALFLKLKFGSWTVMFDVQSIWERHLMWPWHPLAWFLQHAPPLSPQHHDKLDFGFLLVPLGAAIAGLTRLRISYSAYIWISVGFFSCWVCSGLLRASISSFFLSLSSSR